jgi:hypothetical protein
LNPKRVAAKTVQAQEVSGGRGGDPKTRIRNLPLCFVLLCAFAPLRENFSHKGAKAQRKT